MTWVCQSRKHPASGQSEFSHLAPEESSKVMRQTVLCILSWVFAKLLVPFGQSAVKSIALWQKYFYYIGYSGCVHMAVLVVEARPGQLNAHWHWVLILIVVVFPLSLCLCTAGKLLSYMPYDMKLALDQETHSGRPGSPYRLSPRELSKASPQPDPNAPSASRYSVPPGKSTHLHFLFRSLSCLPSSLAWLPLSLLCLRLCVSAILIF